MYTHDTAVSGNGTYGSGGYTLPTTGTVTGTYTWTVSYSGDANNNSAVDQGGTAEQTVKGALTYYYCSHREGWCRKGTADLEIPVKGR